MKQFKTESKRILDLMINSIYTNKEIFLRELISNASDAIDKLKFISLTNGQVKSDFAITIKRDKENRILTISDNGIGMTDKQLEKHLGTIAESGTLAFKTENKEKTEEELIGQFGVGFYSAFMVADKIEVLSKSFESEKAYRWTSVGVEGYEIKEDQKDGVGTDVILYLKEDTEDVRYSDYLDDYRLSALVKRYSDYIRYPIQMEMSASRVKEGSPADKPEYETISEIRTLNSMVPLWKKPKSEVTDDQLNSLYKELFHDYTDSLKSVYAKIEGTVTYDTLLYFPAKAPIDYYSKDFKKGLRLYSNGVMIMEKCEELLPDYFGFVKGIVDSSDLNLNISREILQQDRQVKAIANSIEKKISSELKKMLEEDRENYEKLFTEFGLSIKFGVYQGFGMNKDKLKDFLMFYSSRKEKLVTLAEYVKGMLDGQEEIYYACGESYEKINQLPQIEKAKDKGYEILYFKDGVDEFVAKILFDFEGKKFKSVSEANFSLETEEEKKELEKQTDENKQLFEEMKKHLEGQVKDIKLTANLLSHPVCLISDGEVSIEMEKVMASLPNSDKNFKAQKILEISSTHKILQTLKNLYESDKEKLKDYTIVLYNQARLLEGLPIEETAKFVDSLANIM